MARGVRDQLIDIAERIAATRGLGSMTLSDVQVESGQRNKSVVQYYFGSRQGLIEAVMEARMGAINTRRLAMLEALGDRPGIRALVDSFVSPLAEVAINRAGSYWARFLLQASFDPTFGEAIRASFAASSFRRVRKLLIAGLGDVPDDLRRHRVDQMVEFVLVSLAGAEEARNRGRLGAAAASRHVEDLLDMCCGMLTAPSTALRSGSAAAAEV